VGRVFVKLIFDGNDPRALLMLLLLLPVKPQLFLSAHSHIFRNLIYYRSMCAPAAPL
jgi:hypothetical protein